jgi:hypothetical protein
MVKSYTKLIGIFQGKQAKHNIQILTLLYDSGPLTAWEITGKIARVGNRQSLHATFNKRLRSLEKKGYLKKAGKKWCLQFKGIIAAILIQKAPKPISNKWAEILGSFSQQIKEHFSELSDMTVQASGVSYRPFEGIDKTVEMLNTFDDWITLSNFVKSLIQTGVVNFDVISNETLFTVILSEISHKATDEEIKDFMKDWNIQMTTSKPNDDAETNDE